MSYLTSSLIIFNYIISCGCWMGQHKARWFRVGWSPSCHCRFDDLTSVQDAIAVRIEISVIKNFVR